MNLDRLSGLSSSEKFAAIAVERATGALAVPHDVGGRQGAYDFSLKYQDGRTGAVEVTSHAGPGQRQLESLLGRDDFKWENPGNWAWWVELIDPADIPYFREIYSYIIKLCEKYDVVSPDMLPWRVQSKDSALKWLSTRQIQMRGDPDLPAADRDCRRPVYLRPPGGGGAVDEELRGLDGAISELLTVESVARRIPKVSNADVDERHLFVAVDTSGLPFPVSCALLGRVKSLPTNSRLVLPERLTHLWLAPRFSAVLLGWTEDGGWRSHDVFG